MGLSTTERQLVRAEAKWVRLSARKARIVLTHIRGLTVPEARTVLLFTDRAAAREIEKVLRSAVANAEANHNLNGDDLIVSEAYADEGPTLKRWRARARGRVARIKKRTCHITVALAENPKAGQGPKRRAVATTPAKSDEPASESKPKRRTPAKKKEAAA
jgi:large subunit ribosomal protein L22